MLQTRPWRRWVGWVMLVAFVVVAAAGVDWSGVFDYAAAANPEWLVLAVLVNATILVFSTAAWLFFLPRGAHVSPQIMFSVVAVTSTASNSGPLFAGHAAGIHLLSTRAGLGPAGGTSIMILDQIAEGLAKWTLVVLAASMVPGFEYRAAGLTIVLGAPGLALGFAVLAQRRHFLKRLADGWRGWTGTVLRFVSDTVHRLDALRRPGLFGVGVGLAVTQKVAEGLGIAAVALALGVHLLPWHVLAAVLAVNLSTLVSLTPGNLGLYEGSLFLVLRAAAVDADLALALALLSHVTYLLPLAGTGLALESLRMWRGLPDEG
jgi:uncharacterized protein (TIRG00374 family)